MADLSGTITADSTAQDIAQYNPGRQGFFIQNPSDVDLWIAFGANAVAASPSLKVPPDGYIALGKEHQSTIVRRMSIIGGTGSATKAFTAFDSNV